MDYLLSPVSAAASREQPQQQRLLLAGREHGRTIPLTDVLPANGKT
jgi:hypothetical protein